MSVVAVILAGGASTRFGGDKLDAELDERPLLHHPIEACASVAPVIVLVLAPDAQSPALPSDLAQRVIVTRDRVRYLGPLAGLLTGLEVASERVPDADTALVVGGDMPALVPGVLRLLIDRVSARPRSGVPAPGAVILGADPRATLPMAVRITVAEPAARRLLDADRRSLHALLDRVPSASIDAATWRALDPAGRTISDIDTPDDLTAARDGSPQAR
jgi:molybdenum cofactor guanylyltransferase